MSSPAVAISVPVQDPASRVRITSAQASARYTAKKKLALGKPLTDLESAALKLLPQRIGPSLTNAEKCRRQRLTKKSNIASRLATLSESMPANNYSASHHLIRDPAYCNIYWKNAMQHFELNFIQNTFGHVCDICDRLWFKLDLKRTKAAYSSILEPIFGPESINFLICRTCRESLYKKRLPRLSTSNGFVFPKKPIGLPKLDPLTTRLISPRIPFMSLRRLRFDRGALGIVGQVINVPVDVNTMVRSLPRQVDDDYAINVNFKRRRFHKTSYLSGFVKKSVIKAWLEYLVKTPLYVKYGIQIDWQVFNALPDIPDLPENSDLFEKIPLVPRGKLDPLIARQQTLLWNEDLCLEIAPGEHTRPFNLILDEDVEELAFPEIYNGYAREFRPGLNVTLFDMATSEIRRRDRRAATPHHILFMVSRIMRQRVCEGIRGTFRKVAETTNITRRMLEDPKFIDNCVKKDFAFLKSIPNSTHIWHKRKLDLFAMIRQLGKPTIFLTVSANEVNWPNLIKTLHSLSDEFKDESPDNLTPSQIAHLVNEDPVTCCLYFNKLVEYMLKLLRKPSMDNPFGNYFVKDYFLRIEFQHRGSPHAHILLWLNNDPDEAISEHMPETIKLVTSLFSVSRQDVTEDVYLNQIHHHTPTCTKRGEDKCRFNIPFWPIKDTCVLLPIPKEDIQIGALRHIANYAKKVLQDEDLDFVDVDSFVQFLGLRSYEIYLNVIRSTLTRPTLMFKRSPSEKMTNTFNPCIASIFRSNIDIQFLIDYYSCANYIVDYINKANRGLSNLHCELVKLAEEYPELRKEQLLRKIGLKVLNSLEMSSQEASWVLLRLPMCRTSRQVIYIPTNRPADRFKIYKKKRLLSLLPLDSTDVWTSNIIQKYESREHGLSDVCLADFVSRLGSGKRKVDIHENFDIHDCQPKKGPLIIRYRSYDPSSHNDDFKREMVTLFLPFRNELVDVLDRNKYLDIFAANIDVISRKRSEFERVNNFADIVDELQKARDAEAKVDIANEQNVSNEEHLAIYSSDNEAVEDLFCQVNPINKSKGSSTACSAIVRKRDNVLSKDDYCKFMRTTNFKQRELILEVLHRLKNPDSPPMQIFFTGPAGSGKTYVLKLIMDTINRFSTDANELGNSYLACASTGKAAVNLGGTTVHSGFQLTTSTKQGPIPNEALHRFRSLFHGVRYIIIDEISMTGSGIFHLVHNRLQQVTGDHLSNFGSMPMIICGDFRQLPPVHATAVYKPSKSHLRANHLWHSLDYFHLDQVMRQSDLEFSTILTKIGDGSSLTNAETQLIESRFRTEQWCADNAPNAIRLYHTNSSCNYYNNIKLKDGFHNIANDVYIGHRNYAQYDNAKRNMHRKSHRDTGNLVYCVDLVIGCPYMITTNIDIQDGIVNGLIGILRYFKKIPCADETDPEGRMVVWLEFDDLKTGLSSRTKFNNTHGSVLQPDNLLNTCVPILSITASVPLGGSVRCKRTQLPIISASAITIHKSQGATFKEAVVEYDKSMRHDLLYVAMSRVSSIQGLYLVSTYNYPNFYHKNGCSSPVIKDVRDEYERLSRHPLQTLTKSMLDFISRPLFDYSSSNLYPNIIISTINAQSLVAHHEDISTDLVLCQSDILCITETWMDDVEPVEISHYSLICCSSNLNKPSTSRCSRRQPGGVAIYSRNNASVIPSDRSSFFTEFGESVFTILNIPSARIDSSIDRRTLKLLLCTIYIHPSTSKTNTIKFLSDVLGARLSEYDRFLLTGDFNINVSDDDWIINFLHSEFSLTYVPSSGPTTLGSTSIDLTFTKNLKVDCSPYVAYFSYHRPLILKISPD